MRCYLEVTILKPSVFTLESCYIRKLAGNSKRQCGNVDQV